MKKVIFFAFTIIFWLSASVSYSQDLSQRVMGEKNKEYLSNEIIIKFKNASERGMQILQDDVLSELDYVSVLSVEAVFRRSGRKSAVGLDNVYSIKYLNETDPKKLASVLSESDDVLWAEPRYIRYLHYEPNDSLYSEQTQLHVISAEDAWDVTKGDTSIVIAVCDTGVDWFHEDLEANIWHNWAENPTNGIDDDGNGFVDDHIGWNFYGTDGEANNDPRERSSLPHGTHVSGIASGVTDNGKGIASIGYTCKIMPVNVGKPHALYGEIIGYAPEGIVYAADNGADVINCSFGSLAFSQLEYEAVIYAIEQGSLVIASAGNDGNESPQYPASIDLVFSVANAFNDGELSWNSQRNHFIDVTSLGSSVLSTWLNNGYYRISGTSMAAPLVSGLAGLVKSVHPDLHPLQVAEIIRNTTDNIDSLNLALIGKYGSGLINAKRAVTENILSAVRFYDVSIHGEGVQGKESFLAPGENISFSGYVTNYFDAVDNVSISISSPDEFVEIVNGAFSAGAFGSMETKEIPLDELVFQISEGTPPNHQIHLIVTVTGGDFSGVQHYTVFVNKTITNFGNNEMLLTVSDNGSFGKKGGLGVGLRFRDAKNVLYRGSFMLGNAEDHFSEAGHTTNIDFQLDFSNTIRLEYNDSKVFADNELNSSFSDESANSNSLNVAIDNSFYAWDYDESQDMIIIRYDILNSSDSLLQGLYAGLYMDFDFEDYETDVAKWVVSEHYGLFKDSENQNETKVAVALISDSLFGFVPLDMYGENSWVEGTDSTEIFKWHAIISGVDTAETGPTDVAGLISGGPFDIEAGEKKELAFAICCSFEEDSLDGMVRRAKDKWHGIVTEIDDREDYVPETNSLYQNYPNPFNPKTTIRFGLKESGAVSIVVYDVLGSVLESIYHENLSSGYHTFEFDGSRLPSGIYFYQISTNDFVETKKMILLK